MRPRNIELHIEELVLHGFSQGDRYRIAEAVERELTQLFTEIGVPQSLSNGGEIERLDGGAFEMTHRSKPEGIGAQVARAVYGGKIK
jgi:hypothetical protein